jgi:Zn-dependent protease
MQTLHGIRFLPVARVDGMLLGLDARWLDKRGLVLLALLMLANPAGVLNHDGALPLWLRIAIGLATVAAFVVTSLGHELGHVIAGRLAGLRVRAIVLAPQGSMTIRASSHRPAVNFWTALAGPVANAMLGLASIALLMVLGPGHALSTLLIEFGLLQFITAVANLVPCGPLDGQRIMAAWRALQHSNSLAT